MSTAHRLSWIVLFAAACGDAPMSDSGTGDSSGTGPGGTSTTGVSSSGEPTSAGSSGASSSDESGGVSAGQTMGDATSDTTSDASSGTGETGDGGSSEGSSDTGEPLGSRCEETAELVTCPKLTIELGPFMRDVHYQVPLGEPPAAGWPVVLMFQGSLFSAELTWVGVAGSPFGAYHQTRVVKRLLDDGYAVVTPETKGDGGTFWDTNVPPYSLAWETSEDHQLMLLIFAAIEDGTFGPLDPDRRFATGISSGGYMTSRMAVAYPGQFRALAIAAGSYATCSGPLCDVPALAAEHPPTLFLHGGIDLTVPLSTAEEYHAALMAAGVETEMVVDPAEGHAWIPASPDGVSVWFADHP